MKTWFLISVLVFVSVSAVAQPAKRLIKDTARTPIEGTVFKDGQVNLSAGFRVSLSRDRKIATISKTAGNSIKGSYSCDCPGMKCAITTKGAAIICSGEQGCQMISTTRKIDFAAPDTSPEDVESTRWKFLVIPQ